MEQEIMNIILNAGNARAKCLIALKTARTGDLEKAEEQLKVATESIVIAHKYQTELIQREVSGEKQEVNLLMVHAQDHLMTALAIKDMVIELIEFAREINDIKNNMKGGVNND